MDALSNLLSLFPVHSALTVKCNFGAPWTLDHISEARGIAPYHLITAGAAILDMPGKEKMHLEAGDIVVLPNGSAHKLYIGNEAASPLLIDASADHALPLKYNREEGDTTHILCGQFKFEEEGSGLMLASLPDIILVRTKENDEFSALQALIGILKSETDISQPGTFLLISQLASALFALLIRAWLKDANLPPGIFAALSEKRLHGALKGLLSKPELPWAIEDMAKACHMSRATFARLFREVAGFTPATLLTQIRMARAVSLLGKGQHSVGTIAELVGYQSESAFNRIFKNTYGVGPGKYMRVK